MVSRINIFKQIANAIKPNNTVRSQSVPSNSFFPSFTISHGRIVPNVMANVTIAEALKIPELFNAVNLIASDVASCTFENTAPYTDLLTKPSKLISCFNFWQSAVAQMLLTGNSYLLIHRFQDNNQPAYLEQIPTANVELLILDDGTDLIYKINFDDDRKSVDVSSSEMIHLRLIATGESDNTLMRFVGISPLDSLVQTLDVNQNSDRLILKQLQKAILPANIITLPEVQVNKERKAQIREDFESQYTGDGAGSTIVLDQSAKLSQLDINSDVSKFLSTIDANAGRIATAFGIPAGYLSPNKSDNQSNVSQIESLYINNLTRYIDPVVSELRMKLQLPNLELDVNSAIDRDGQMLINNIQKLTSGTNPILSADEAKNLMSNRGVINEDEIN